MYLQLIAHGIAFMPIRSTIFTLYHLVIRFLGYSKLDQFGGCGTLTSANIHKTDPLASQ
jgi:hypothetical protein